MASSQFSHGKAFKKNTAALWTSGCDDEESPPSDRKRSRENDGETFSKRRKMDRTSQAFLATANKESGERVSQAAAVVGSRRSFRPSLQDVPRPELAKAPTKVRNMKRKRRKKNVPGKRCEPLRTSSAPPGPLRSMPNRVAPVKTEVVTLSSDDDNYCGLPDIVVSKHVKFHLKLPPRNDSGLLTRFSPRTCEMQLESDHASPRIAVVTEIVKCFNKPLHRFVVLKADDVDVKLVEFGVLAKILDASCVKVTDATKELQNDMERLLGSHSVRRSKLNRKTSPEQGSLHMDAPPFHALVYPPNDRGAITITARDLELLYPGEFLNDSIIDFYLKFIERKIMDPQCAHLYHFFNSFLYMKLCQIGRRNMKESTAALKKWTSRTNFFKKKYVFIPINEHLHWTLAVVCNLDVLWEELPEEHKPAEPVEAQSPARPRSPTPPLPDENSECVGEHSGSGSGDPATPRPVPKLKPLNSITIDDHEQRPRPFIILFDSLGSRRSKPANLIYDFLSTVWEQKTTTQIDFRDFGHVVAKVPQQNNSCDCGVFVLEYIEQFVRKFSAPDIELHRNNVANYLTPSWFTVSDVTEKRQHLLKLIRSLHASPGDA